MTTSNGHSIVIKTGHGNLHVNPFWLENNLHVHLKIGKSGSCESADTEAIARMINVALKYGAPVEEIVGHLSNIACEHVVIGKSSSIADGISRALKDLPKRE
ncbi:TSCPD domain-containing protein [Candidatus Daviesbacteria bacterium]|nr:TSCPD domain-containing protein [Candidatus Daviesbacteria bacterium]